MNLSWLSRIKCLKQSEQRYRNIVEDQTEFISRFLPDGTHVFVNEAYCRYFNKTRDELIGKKFIPPVPAEDQNLVKEHFASLTKDHPTAIITHRILLRQWPGAVAALERPGNF